MSSALLRFVIVLALPASLLAWGQSAPNNGGDFSSNTEFETKLRPTGVILGKAAPRRVPVIPVTPRCRKAGR